MKQKSIDVQQLASERISSFVNKAMLYWRLIGSSGLLFTVIVLLIVGMIYYEDMLALIPEQTPMAFIYACLFTYLVARTSHRTFLKEADLLFLTPVETKMGDYMNQTFRYNLILQGIGLFVVLILCAPLFIDLVLEQQSMWLYYAVPLILKGWNLQSSWVAQKWHSNSLRWYHTLLRGAFTFVFLFWFYSSGPLLVIFLFAGIIALFFLFERKVNREHAYNWLRLLELENQLLGRFYNFCNAFVDVPHLRSKVKKRNWITWVTRYVRYDQSNVYKYLYVKTFLRANDYFGIYIRLTLIGMGIVYALTDPWAQWVVYLLFLFLVGTQIQAVWGHHKRQFWLTIFPVTDEQAIKSFQWLTFWLLSGQAILMLVPICLFGQGTLNHLALLGVGLLFAYVYSCFYMKKK